MPKLPNVTRPCRDCPFRKDSMKGWLGKERMERILASGSFTCHKKRHLQCAGHMLLKGEESTFVQLAGRLGMELDLSGRELVFDSRRACVEHHTVTLNLDVGLRDASRALGRFSDAADRVADALGSDNQEELSRPAAEALVVMQSRSDS
ncbi:DUF6283 family protein [Aeromonas caviae]|uniref:Uncharacterized protein n=1 Tax=Aeromonas caviae TaxID=648 RepID=A0AAV4YFK1_AERCA|nr:DUF6283 family protein [Aeromonas caviae]GJA39636.1 hypothetical protein KAM343_04320 [Aeromonas caviae]